MCSPLFPFSQGQFFSNLQGDQRVLSEEDKGDPSAEAEREAGQQRLQRVHVDRHEDGGEAAEGEGAPEHGRHAGARRLTRTQVRSYVGRQAGRAKCKGRGQL